jgi:hypothetical protein
MLQSSSALERSPEFWEFNFARTIDFEPVRRGTAEQQSARGGNNCLAAHLKKSSGAREPKGFLLEERPILANFLRPTVAGREVAAGQRPNRLARTRASL